MSSAAPARTTMPAARLDSLTGLRFIAAALIFVHHATRLFTGPAKISTLRTYLFEPMAIGVSFFFVLSGFVLAYSAKPGQRYGRFEWNRFSRIYPNYLLGLVLSYFVISIQRPIWVWVVNALMLQSWFPRQDVYFSGNPVSWSLSDEAFFYAMFPLLIFLLARRSARGQVVALVLTVVAIAAAQLTAHLIWTGGTKEDIARGLYFANYFPPTRLLEFILGILLALLLPRLPRVPLLPAVVVMIGSIYLVAIVKSPSKWVVASLIPVCLLIVAAAQSDLLERRSLLRNKVLVTLGSWSFALYIIHVLVLDTFIRATGYQSDSAKEAFAVTALVFVICLAASALMFYLWERPIEKVLRRVHLRRRDPGTGEPPEPASTDPPGGTEDVQGAGQPSRA